MNYVADHMAEEYFPGITKFMSKKTYWWQLGGKRERLAGCFNPMFGKKQSEHQKNVVRNYMLNAPKYHREAISKAQTGKNNNFYGRISPHRRPCEYKGVKYPSIHHMAKALNTSRVNCRNWLRKQA